jgi:hypothetical protein
MWCVKMSIPRDKFYDAMSDMGGWLSDAHIDTPNFSYSRDPAGEIRFRICFSAVDDADRFAERFHGSVLPQDFLLD